MRRRKKSSFTSDQLSKKNFMSLKCSKCSNIVEKVDPQVESVLCWECTIKTVPYEEKAIPKKTGFPPGWKIFPVYVHKNGDVYHRGKIQPELKGTLPITEVKQRKRRTKKELDAAKEKKLLKKYNSIQKRKNGRRNKN
jgi:hypothetical protein